MYQKCLSCFIKLPLSSVIAVKTYVTHGGLFRSITKGKKSKTSVDDLKEIGSLEDLSKIRRFVLDPPLNGKNAIIGDILWSAPSMSPGFSKTNQQSFGLLWGPDFTDEFLKNSNLKVNTVEQIFFFWLVLPFSTFSFTFVSKYVQFGYLYFSCIS